MIFYWFLDIKNGYNVSKWLFCYAIHLLQVYLMLVADTEQIVLLVMVHMAAIYV